MPWIAGCTRTGMYLFTLNAVGGKGQQGLLPNRCHVGTRAVALGDWLRCGCDGTSRRGFAESKAPLSKSDCSVACSLRQDRKIEVSSPRARNEDRAFEGWSRGTKGADGRWAEMGEDSSSSNRRMHGVGRKEPWSSKSDRGSLYGWGACRGGPEV